MFEFSVRSSGQSVKAGVVAAGNALPPIPSPTIQDHHHNSLKHQITLSAATLFFSMLSVLPVPHYTAMS